MAVKPLGADGDLIGAPHQGTHTIGNWQSDNAVDVAVPVGTPVYAIAGGTLGNTGSLGSKDPKMAGLRVNLNTAEGNFYYAHLSKLASGVTKGATVKAGQLLGYSGSANGTPHLHFAVEAGDPASYVKGGVQPEYQPQPEQPVPTNEDGDYSPSLASAMQAYSFSNANVVRPSVIRANTLGNDNPYNGDSRMISDLWQGIAALPDSSPESQRYGKYNV